VVEVKIRYLFKYVYAFIYMGRKSKIKQLGMNAEKLVFQAKAEGKSYREIAGELETVFDESVSHQAVKNYYDNNSDDRLKIMGAQNAQQIAKEEMKELLDYRDQLDKINQKLQRAIDELDETERQDMGLLVKLMKENRDQLKFQRKYIEEIVEPSTQVNNIEINQTDVMLEFNKYFNELEDSGAFVCQNCGHKNITIDAKML